MTRRRKSGTSKRKSFSLSEENAQWLENEHADNQSAFMDRMIKSARQGNGGPEIAALEAKLAAKKERREHHRQEAERLDSEIEEIEEEIDERKNSGPSDEMKEAFNVFDNMAGVPDEDNPAVKNWATKTGRSPRELIERYQQWNGKTAIADGVGDD